jgi:hypothetical protein
MNPVSATPAPTPDPQTASSSGLTPDIVSNIPVHNPSGPAPSAGAINEDDELDKIMQDVNHELKKPEKKPDRHNFHFELKHHKKTEPKFSAQPRQVMDVTAQPASAPRPAPTAQAKSVNEPQPTAQQKPIPLKKPPKTHSTPVMAIALTIIATSGLVAAAIYAYK